MALWHHLFMKKQAVRPTVDVQVSRYRRLKAQAAMRGDLFVS